MEGELVYSGPNVMMGYAENPADLARGKEVTSLFTGDIAVQNTDGLFTIVGRKSRFIKPFGLRISLDDVQTHLSTFLPGAACTGDDSTIVIAHLAGQSPAIFIADAAAKFGLPATIFQPVAFTHIPMLSSGKVDYATIKHVAAQKAGQGPGLGLYLRVLFSRQFILGFFTELLAILKIGKQTDQGIDGIFKKVLGLQTVDGTKSFKQLGGDSLSYVAMSIELEDHLGHIPKNWENLSVDELTKLAPGGGASL